MTLLKKKNQIPEGELIFSLKSILKIIVSMLIQQILNITGGMVDSMMVSSAGEAAVSGDRLTRAIVYGIRFFRGKWLKYI